MEHHGFRGAVKLRGPGSGHKEPFVRRPIQGDYSAQDVHCREHGFFFENAETDPVFLNLR